MAGATLQYEPLRPSVPIMLGTWGPRTAEVAGEVADEIKIGGSANPAVVGHLLPNINAGLGIPDPATAGTAAPKPIVAVSLASSSQCAPNGFKDVVVLTFSNQSGPVTPATVNDHWVLTLTGIQYNVGKAVPAGPLHNVPFSQQGVDGTDPLSYQDTPLFGGNDAPGGNDLVAGAILPENQLVGGVANIDATMWTNSAVVSPIVISAVGTPLVADNTFQPLGTVTITEATADGVGFSEPAAALPSSLTHLLFFPGLVLVVTPTAAVTGNAGQTATITGGKAENSARRVDVDVLTPDGGAESRGPEVAETTVDAPGRRLHDAGARDVEERRGVADPGGLLHVVGDDHDRVVLLELEHELLDRGRGDGIERRAGLVHQQGVGRGGQGPGDAPVSYTHLRAHETPEQLVCRLLLEKKT